jgi:PAS domain S-box-containing protein
MRDVLGERAYALLKPAVDRVLGGERFTFDSCIPYKDGGTRDVHIEYVPRKSDEGAITGFYALVQDIGDRKEAEAALRESEARYRTLFENVDAGFCIIEMIFDAEGRPVDYRFLEVNPAFEKQAGFSNAAGRRMREIVPEHEELWFERYGRVAMTGEAMQFEDGSAALGKWWDVHAFRIGAPEQRRVALLFKDVTERRRIDSYLRANEARLRFQNELMDATSALSDADSILAATTHMLGEHLGVDVCAYADMEQDQDAFTIRGDWSAPGAASIVGTYSLADFGGLAVETLRGGEPLVINDNIAQLGEEESREFLRIGLRSTVCMPYLKEGRLAALMAVHCVTPHRWTSDELALVAEVTGRSWAHIERVRSEAALKESEKRFRNMADHAPVMMWVTDAKGYCTYLNRFWCEFTGQTPDQAEGFGRLNATHPEDAPEAERAFREASASRSPFVMEYRLRHSDGGYRWALDAAAPRFGENGEFLGYIGSVIDIDQRRRIERELHYTNEELERRIAIALEEQAKAEEGLRQAQKLEALGQLTGGVAHDFNNLLMIVQAGLNLLERSDEQSRRDMLTARMREAVTRGANLTSQLLAFSRRQELSPEPVDFADLLSGMADLLDRSLGADVEVKLDMAEDLAPIFVDPNALQLAILNLAVNARDAMPKGGAVQIRAANGALEDPRAPSVSISVVDAGEGISPHIMSRIFEPFFTTKEIGKGSGLGLAQVHGFAQQSGGRVEVKSEMGSGTTVTLILPQSKASARPPLKPAMAFRAARATGEAGRVLLVEDDNEVAAVTGEMLEHLGWRVNRVASAEAALVALTHSREIDLMLSDVMMPGGLNGVELAREVRRRRPHLPIILASGYSEGVRREAERAGVPLLPKPFNLDTLAAVIEVTRLN